MTNKESIFDKHHDIVSDNNMPYAKKATSCTTITAEAIERFTEWQGKNCRYISDYGKWQLKGSINLYKRSELVQLFLNQKAKI